MPALFRTLFFAHLYGLPIFALGIPFLIRVLSTRPFIRRGYAFNALWIGALAILLFAAWVTYIFSTFYYYDRATSSPGWWCEWCFVPYAYLLIATVIASLLHFILWIWTVKRLSPSLRSPAKPWQQQVKALLSVLVGIGLIVFLARVIAIGKEKRNQTLLLTKMTTAVSINKPLHYLGRIPQSIDSSWFPLNGYVEKIEISENGRWLLFSNNNRHLNVVDLSDFSFRDDYFATDEWFRGGKGTLDPINNRLALFDIRQLSLFDLESNELLWRLPYEAGIVDMAFAPTGETLLIQRAVYNDENYLAVVSPHDGKPITTLELDSYPLWRWSLSGHHLAVIQHQHITIYDYPELVPRWTLEIPTSSRWLPYSRLGFRSDNEVVFTLHAKDRSEQLYQWNLATEEVIVTLIEAGEVGAWETAVYPTRRYVVRPSFDFRAAALLDLHNKEIADLGFGEYYLNAICFSPDRRFFVVAAADGYLHFFSHTRD